eukprot:Skav207580  [mRNA]  locus=scaffold2931:115063:122557:- [translate_table: standard]
MLGDLKFKHQGGHSHLLGAAVSGGAGSPSVRSSRSNNRDDPVGGTKREDPVGGAKAGALRSKLLVSGNLRPVRKGSSRSRSTRSAGSELLGTGPKDWAARLSSAGPN